MGKAWLGVRSKCNCFLYFFFSLGEGGGGKTIHRHINLGHHKTTRKTNKQNNPNRMIRIGMTAPPPLPRGWVGGGLGQEEGEGGRGVLGLAWTFEILCGLAASMWFSHVLIGSGCTCTFTRYTSGAPDKPALGT